MLNGTARSKVISALQKIFARFGLPEQLVFDNRLQFASEVFRQFCETNAIRHIRVSPYHPSSNGAAERLVQTFKESMKKQTVKQPQLRLDNFLRSYRATPQSTTNCSPAEMMLGRPLRTKLSLVKPDVTVDVACKQASQKDYHDRTSCSRAFMVGQHVQAWNLDAMVGNLE